jgi:hypothetical protein
MSTWPATQAEFIAPPHADEPPRRQPDDLAAAAAELNARPRKTLGWDTPVRRLGL